jgi:GTP-binding protein HflX
VSILKPPPDPTGLTDQKPRRKRASDQIKKHGIFLVCVTIQAPPRGHDRAGILASPPIPMRSPAEVSDEAGRLVAALDLPCVGTDHAVVKRITPATLLGSGVVETLAEAIKASHAEVVVVNAALSPIQQRNLEKIWQTKVIDRTGLILEIFARRAQTREGQMQVALAQLHYQRSRLVRAWTHLERQRATGKTGGPGETQIELDRRKIDDAITRLRCQLDHVVQNRDLQRQARRKVPYPIVALAGYTNAGKSTLFNTLTRADVLAKDMLFATLDPTMRRLDLPSGTSVILSDTVGFISDLPTELVAAFRATLEEVTQSAVVVHVVDMASAVYDADCADVETVLGGLGINCADPDRVIIAFNKSDLATPERHSEIERICAQRGGAVIVSALTGQGLPALLAMIQERVTRGHLERIVTIDPARGAARAWLYDHADVINETVDPDTAAVTLRLRILSQRWGQFTDRFGDQ